MNRVTTSEFRIGQGTYLLSAGMCLARRPLLLLLLFAGAAAVAGVAADVRWLVVALMLFLIVLPMLAAMVYFNYGLRPEGFVNVLDHEVTFTPAELSVKVRFPVPEDEGGEGDECEARVREYTFAMPAPVPYTVGAKHLIIHLGHPQRGVLIVPYDAFAGTHELECALDCLSKKR